MQVARLAPRDGADDAARYEDAWSDGYFPSSGYRDNRRNSRTGTACRHRGTGCHGSTRCY
jgi:hypothetical protein